MKMHVRTLKGMDKEKLLLIVPIHGRLYNVWFPSPAELEKYGTPSE